MKQPIGFYELLAAEASSALPTDWQENELGCWRVRVQMAADAAVEGASAKGYFADVDRFSRSTLELSGQVALAHQFNATSLGRAVALQGAGRWHLATGPVTRVKVPPIEVQEIRCQFVRNSMAPSFQNPREKKESEEAVQSSMFLSSIYRLIGEKDENGAMRMIYRHVHNLRMLRRYTLCDRILADVDEKKLAPFLLVSLLTITAPVRRSLLQRASFFRRAKDAISALCGREETEQTLVGLE
jgi:hypothetical protein